MSTSFHESFTIGQQDELKRVGVRHYGFIDKKDSHARRVSIWITRFFILYKGRLLHLSCSDFATLMQAVDEMSKNGIFGEKSISPADESRAMDLPPDINFVDVSPEELTIYMKEYTGVEGIFAMASWGLKQKTEEILLHSIRDHYILRFETEQDKEEWKEKIKSESTRSFLPEDLEKQFSKRFHEEIWRSVRCGRIFGNSMPY